MRQRLLSVTPSHVGVSCLSGLCHARELIEKKPYSAACLSCKVCNCSVLLLLFGRTYCRSGNRRMSNCAMLCVSRLLHPVCDQYNFNLWQSLEPVHGARTVFDAIMFGSQPLLCQTMQLVKQRSRLCRAVAAVLHIAMHPDSAMHALLCSQM